MWIISSLAYRMVQKSSDCGKNISNNNVHICNRARHTSRVVKYNTKSFHHLTAFFMSAWWGVCKSLKSHGGFLSYFTCKIGEPIQPIWQLFLALLWSALKKSLWELNFLHIFSEKCCQILESLFVVFHYSRNILWWAWCWLDGCW